MYDPETTDLPVLDHFEADGLLHLSQRLMDWYEDPLSDDEIVAVLGEDLLQAFRYAQTKLTGKVRRVTLEPAFCHSADVAFRAAELGFPNKILEACFLHDVIEDVSKSLPDVHREVAALSERFEPTVVSDVMRLTNRYQIIFKQLRPRVSSKIPIDARAVRAFRAALDVVRYELPEQTFALYASEFAQIARFLEQPLDLSHAHKLARRDRSFTLSTFLEREAYNLYVDDLVRDARERTLSSEGRELVTPLIVKFMDLIDNVRTSEVSNRLSLYKLVTKAESIIDRTQRGFIERVPPEHAVRTTIPTLLRIVQVRLIDQLKLRRRAVANNFSESRFAGLVDFLGEQARRLEGKYRVEKDRVVAFSALEDQVRAWNRASGY